MNFTINEITINYTKTETEIGENFAIGNHKDVENVFRKFWKGDINVQESLYAMYLSKNNRVKGISLIAMGGVDACLFDMKLIFAPAVKCLASAIIVIHNHPSGNTKASKQDNLLTKKLKEACDVLDITLLDNLIITENDCVSIL